MQGRLALYPQRLAINVDAKTVSSVVATCTTDATIDTPGDAADTVLGASVPAVVDSFELPVVVVAVVTVLFVVVFELLPAAPAAGVVVMAATAMARNKLLNIRRPVAISTRGFALRTTATFS